MKRMDPEELLAQLGEISREDLGGSVPDDKLRDLRAGNLSEEEARRLEALLARIPAARRRLAELAGVDRRGPSEVLRERVLAEFSAAAKPRRIRRLWQTAAGIAAAAALAVGLWSAWGPVSYPPVPAHHASVVGESGRRAPTGGIGHVAEVYSDTTLRIRCQIAARPIAGLSYGLFRVRGGRLERVEAEMAKDRRGATFRGKAADILGTSRPGTYQLFVVASWEDDLPDSTAIRSGDELRMLGGASENTREVDRVSVVMRAWSDDGGNRQ